MADLDKMTTCRVVVMFSKSLANVAGSIALFIERTMCEVVVMFSKSLVQSLSSLKEKGRKAVCNFETNLKEFERDLTTNAPHTCTHSERER